MALNYNFSKVADHEKLHEDNNEWQATDVLIWMTMAVGIHTITEDNHKEFYARLHLLEKLNGAMRTEGGKEKLFTLEEVKRRIGLSTNASTLTRNQFIKVKTGRYFDEIVK